MDLMLLLKEAKTNPHLVTIEATVTTGFEVVAMEEIRKKWSIPVVTTRGRVYFNIPEENIDTVEELRSVDNISLVIKVAEKLSLSCNNIDDDINILKKELNYDEILRGLDIWCKKRKFKGIVLPSEVNYELAKATELEIKNEAKSYAENWLKENNDVAIASTSRNDQNSLITKNKIFNIIEFKAYNEIDKRKPEDKVLKFRVSCTRHGKHCFSSQEAAYHVGGSLQDMFHWVVDLCMYDLEVLVNIKNDLMIIGFALTIESKHHRNIKYFGPTTLRSTTCYAMLHIAKPKVGDIIIDPMCGGGSIPIEGSLAFPDSYYLCGDIHSKAVPRTYKNLEWFPNKRNNIDIFYWDATCLALKDSSVDIFVSDLPFGKRSGSLIGNRKLYVKLLFELARVVRCKTGRAVLLTYDKRSMSAALNETNRLWWFSKKLKVNVGGLTASVYVLWRTNELTSSISSIVK